MEWKNLVNEMNKNASQKYDEGVNTVLDRLGLQEKRSTSDVVLPMIGVFGAGIAVGATLGMLFAPKRGDALRHDLRHSIEDLQQRGKVRASEMVEREHANSGESRGSEAETPSAE